MKIKVNNLKLIFYGTRGFVDDHSKNHYFHTSILIKSPKTSVLLDYGEINRNNLDKIKPDYILVSHSHPDHMAGLTNQSVVCSKDTQKTSRINFPRRIQFKFKKTFSHYKPFYLGDIKFLPLRIYHSIRAPMTAFIIIHGKTRIWTATDYVHLKRTDFKKYFRDIDLVIIDGSTNVRDLIRIKKVGKRQVPFGHLSLDKQIKRMKGCVRKFIVTHIGGPGIRMGDDKIFKKIKKLHPEVSISIATDEPR